MKKEQIRKIKLAGIGRLMQQMIFQLQQISIRYSRKVKEDVLFKKVQKYIQNYNFSIESEHNTENEATNF